MGVVLDRKYTKEDSREDILGAIIKLASDKLARFMVRDDNEWKQVKLTEIARLAKILKKKL
jgi:hypothetical protein